MKINYSKASLFAYLAGLILLIFLFLPMIPYDTDCEFIYGSGDWNPYYSGITFQSAEDISVDQTSLALSRGHWKTVGTRFSPESKEETDWISRFNPPRHTRIGKIHIATEIYNHSGFIRLSVSNDLHQWLSLAEIGLNPPDPSLKNQWVSSKLDLAIPSKFLKAPLYVKISGSSVHANSWVAVEQWGIKTWKLRSVFSFFWRDFLDQKIHEIRAEGSFLGWIHTHFFSSYQEVPGLIPDPPTVDNIHFAYDQNPLTYALLPLSRTSPYNLPFLYTVPENSRIDKIKLFFWGDLHRSTSYHPTHYTIEAFSNNDQKWVAIADNKNQRSPVASHILPSSLITQKLKITFHRAYRDHSVALGEISAYQRQETSWWRGFLFWLGQYNKSLPASFLYSFCFLAMIFFPGFLLCQLLFPRLLDVHEKFILSPLFGVLGYILASVIGYVTGQNQIYLIFIPFSAITFIFFFYKKWYLLFSKLEYSLCTYVFLLLAFNILYQHHRDLIYALPHIENYLDKLPIPTMPYYGYHGDNLLQWRISKVFLHHFNPASAATIEYVGKFDRFGTNDFFHRTPFLPLLNVPFLYIFGESHFIYQKLLTVLAELFLIPLFFLLARLFNLTTAKIACLCMLLNFYYFFIHLAVEVYLKYFALFPLCIALFLIEKRGIQNNKFNFIIAIACAASYLIHNAVGMLYILSLCFYVLLRNDSFMQKIKFYATLALCGLVLASPWFLFYYYHQSFVHDPIGSLYSENVHSGIQSGGLIRRFIQGIISILFPVTAKPGFIGSNLGLFQVLSPGFFILFFLSLKDNWKNFWKWILFSFLPCAIMISIYGEGSAVFGYYLLIPICAGLCIYWTISKNRTGGSLLLKGILLQYIFFNLWKGYEWGSYNKVQLQAVSLQLSHYVTAAGILMYILIVVFLLFKAAHDTGTFIAE